MSKQHRRVLAATLVLLALALPTPGHAGTAFGFHFMTGDPAGPPGGNAQANVHIEVVETDEPMGFKGKLEMATLLTGLRYLGDWETPLLDSGWYYVESSEAQIGLGKNTWVSTKESCIIDNGNCTASPETKVATWETLGAIGELVCHRPICGYTK